MLEKTLESLLTARKSNQSILKEINPENSLERLMLKLQYFGHLTQRANTQEETLILEKIEGRRRRGQHGWDDWMASPAQWTMRLSKLWKIAKDREAWCPSVNGVTKSWTWLSDWTILGKILLLLTLEVVSAHSNTDQEICNSSETVLEF